MRRIDFFRETSSPGGVVFNSLVPRVSSRKNSIRCHRDAIPCDGRVKCAVKRNLNAGMTSGRRILCLEQKSYVLFRASGSLIYSRFLAARFLFDENWWWPWEDCERMQVETEVAKRITGRKKKKKRNEEDWAKGQGGWATNHFLFLFINRLGRATFWNAVFTWPRYKSEMGLVQTSFTDRGSLLRDSESYDWTRRYETFWLQ